jgi:hypothetical protein
MDLTECTLVDVGDQPGTVVVIDVLRAFTTAAVALAAGAGPYELVATVDEAHARRRADPTIRLLGEVDGRTAEGFDLGNSPVAIDGVDLSGVGIVHRSSAGTQGVVRATSADRVLAASFANAGATTRALAGVDRVAFCITGDDDARDGDEDRSTRPRSPTACRPRPPACSSRPTAAPTSTPPTSGSPRSSIASTSPCTSTASTDGTCCQPDRPEAASARQQSHPPPDPPCQRLRPSQPPLPRRFLTCTRTAADQRSGNTQPQRHH